MSKEVQEAIKELKCFNDGYTFRECAICQNYNEKTLCCDIKKCDNLKALETLLQDHEKQSKIIYQLKDAIVKYEKAEHYRVESDVVEYFKNTLNGKENNLF